MEEDTDVNKTEAALRKPGEDISQGVQKQKDEVFTFLIKNNAAFNVYFVSTALNIHGRATYTKTTLRTGLRTTENPGAILVS